MQRDNQIVSHIIGINVLVWIFTFIMENQGVLLNRLGGMQFFQSPYFQPWQILTHMFMHGGPWHIALNMYALYLFGSILERVWGWKRFLFFYISAGLGAALLHQVALEVQCYIEYGSLFAPELSSQAPGSMNWFEWREKLTYLARTGEEAAADKMYQNLPPLFHWWVLGPGISNVVGASGAVMGVVVAFGLLFPNTRLQLLFPPIPIAAKHLVLLVVGLDIALIVFGINDGIAHWAHLGGAATGFLIVKMWSLNRDSFY